MKFIYLFLIITLSVVSLKIKGQTTDTLQLATLDQVTQAALKNNPTQAIYQQQIRQAYYNYKTSRSFLYPTITGGFDGTDNLHLATTPVPGVIFGRPGTTVYAQFGKNYVYETGLTLNKDLFNWTDFMQMKIAKRNMELTRVQQDAYAQSLKEQVARLYYSVLIARAALEICHRDRLLADSVLVLSKQKLGEGVTDLLSVNEAAINDNTIQQNQAQSQQMLDQSLENLKILLGAKPTAELKLMETLPLDDLSFSLLTRIGADRNIAVSRQQADIAGLQTREQRSAFLPKISVTGFKGAQQFRDDFGLSFNHTNWNNVSYIGLNISVPLFTGFSNHFKYKSSVVQKDIAELQYQTAMQQGEINDRLLQKNYADYLQMLTAAKNTFGLYGQNVRLNQSKYKEGLTSLDIYMKAFQDYLAAENTYLNNLSQLLTVKATFISRQ
jgi:outer membrane protein